jgi:protein-L-isoaspartate(D-aspartate) O-methyltransferase
MRTGATTTVDRTVSPGAWASQAEANVPLIIQWDDGAHSGPAPGTVPTSSASMPSVVARMLVALDAQPGMRVLEIGTGTGWNAGLLAHRLGGANVVSVEVDPAVADRARASLVAAGQHPEVVCSDGTAGYEPGAPYDRIIVTAGVRGVPAAWLTQTRPGGVVVAPWGTHYSHQEAVLRLTVQPDGSAYGPFREPVEFMTLRDQRLDWNRFAGYAPNDYASAAEEVTSTVLGADDLGDRYTPQLFATGLLVPRCAHVVNREAESAKAWFLDLDSVSWAVVEFDGGQNATVRQAGPRRLWNEVADALAWWDQRGRPGIERFGLTVTAGGAQLPWLDDPENVLPGAGRG